MEFFKKVSDVLKPSGFECYPFKVGWYNDRVGPHFQLDYSYDTLAIIVISTPSMFEKAFKPFICRRECTGKNDPIDECVAFQFQKIRDVCPSHNIETIHDFEMHHSRRPKVLVQTAGHVAGAVRYYQKNDVSKEYWDPDKKIFGACIHPKYGGWFALRGVIIFSSVQVADLTKKEPPHTLKSDDDIIDFLEKFNGNWKDWTFRDVIDVEEKYSEDQKNYFATSPKDRKHLVKQWTDKISETESDTS